jgi:hypothetical protein
MAHKNGINQTKTEIYAIKAAGWMLFWDGMRFEQLNAECRNQMKQKHKY